MKTKLSVSGISAGFKFGSREVLGAAFSRKTTEKGTIWAFVVRCSCSDIGVADARDIARGGATCCIKCSHEKKRTAENAFQKEI